MHSMGLPGMSGTRQDVWYSAARAKGAQSYFVAVAI